MKDGIYEVYLDEYKSIGTHWIPLYVNDKSVKYFDSCGVEHFPKETKTLIGDKNVITNIFRIQTYDAIMCRYFALHLLILCSKEKF